MKNESLWREASENIFLFPAVTVSLEDICTHASGHTFFSDCGILFLWPFFPQRSVRTMLVQKRDEIDFYTNSSGIAKQEGRKKLNLQVSFTCRLMEYRGNQENRMKNIACLYWQMVFCACCGVGWGRVWLHCMYMILCGVCSQLGVMPGTWLVFGITSWSPYVPSDCLLLMKDSCILLMFHLTDQTRCSLTCRCSCPAFNLVVFKPFLIEVPPSYWYKDLSSSMVSSFVLVFSLLLYFN